MRSIIAARVGTNVAGARSCVARRTVVVAGSGTAWAALTLSGANVRNGTITSVDIKNGSLSSTVVSRSSRTILKKKGATGPVGDKGATGAVGNTGTAGAKGSAAKNAYAWAYHTEDSLLVDAIPAALVMLPTAALAYLATWTSWFRSPGAYMRQWALENPGEGVAWLPPGPRSLWEYHLKMWEFHNGLTSEHPYEAHPLGWIVQWRPTSFYWRSFDPGEAGCEVERCARAITSLGNPVLWWTAALAVVAAVVLLVWRKDWRALAVLSGIVAGWLPWFVYAERTIFTFYTIVFTPWVVLTLVYVLAVALESTEHRRAARSRVRAGITVLLTTIGAVSLFFYPIWTAWQVPYWFWNMHMWLPSWI